MKTIKQMLRQPLKTASGVILIALAVAVLCVSIGQAMAVRTATKTLKDGFTVIAYPKGSVNEEGNLAPQLNEEMLLWLEKTNQENPGIIKKIARHGILSAYIPELTPLTQEKYVPNTTTGDWKFQHYLPGPYNRPYSCAMLVITLDEVSEPVEQFLELPVKKDPFEDLENWTGTVMMMVEPKGYTIELTGTVTDMISLPEWCQDPMGRIARLTMSAPTLEEIEALNLIPGEQYIVYGMDYMDLFWQWVGTVNFDGRYDFRELEPFEPEKLEILTEEQREKHKIYYELSGNPEWLTLEGYYQGIPMKKEDLWYLNAISLTLDIPLSKNVYEQIRDENGNLLELRLVEGGIYTDLNGETVSVSKEEYEKLYQIPTITRLTGSVEKFLQSDEGTLWQAALERDAINNQAFAVIGVDDLDYLADFSLRRTKIVDGREFTEEDLSTGARVCIIHEELAVANDLQVGDTITPSFYARDPGLPYQNVDQAGEAVNPAASFYFETTPFTETETYTIVGICRGEDTWPNVAENAYAFSANTVYVPKSSVETPMEYRDGIPFVTVVLENSQIQQFHELTTHSGYAGYFKYSDQGYTQIAENFFNYQDLAIQVLWIGTVIYVIMLALFLLLYPGAMRKNVKLMQSLGAGFGRRFGSVLMSALAILIPSTIAGGLTGMLLWGSVAKMMQKYAGAALTLQMEPEVLWTVTAAQLPLAVVLSLIVAVFVATPSRMSDRR